MERLTDKNHRAINTCGEYSSCYACKRTICYIGELEQKLGELEDVLEKYGIENLEEYICALKEELNEIQTCLNKEIDNNCDLYDALLKNEQALAELKQNAIVPKYQVGQTLFRIDFGAIVPFVVNEIYVHIKADKTISIQYFDYVGLVIEENELFVTKEEAEQKLAETGGRK